jgi:hypothetical protein
VRRLFFLTILAIVLAGLILFGISDATISIADTNVRNNESNSGASEASNSSASATITITMTGIADQ